MTVDLRACLACGRSLATCVRLVEKSDRGCCKECAHPTPAEAVLFGRSGGPDV